jgi:hypothetical protein
MIRREYGSPLISPSFFPISLDSTAKTKFTLDSAVLFPHFDSVVRRKQSLSWIPPFLLPRLLLWYGENRVFFLFRRLFFLVRLRQQQFPEFSPILLLSTSSEKTVGYEL